MAFKAERIRDPILKGPLQIVRGLVYFAHVILGRRLMVLTETAVERVALEVIVWKGSIPGARLIYVGSTWRIEDSFDFPGPGSCVFCSLSALLSFLVLYLFVGSVPHCVWQLCVFCLFGSVHF